MWKVTYEDADWEELDDAELQAAIVWPETKKRKLETKKRKLAAKLAGGGA